MNPKVAETLPLFTMALQHYCNEAHQKQFGPSAAENCIEISAKIGNKYAKIVKKDGQRSVHCFIDLETGDILKAASWSAPAKHARGSIFNENMDIGTAVGVYGAVYLK